LLLNEFDQECRGAGCKPVVSEFEIVIYK